ncbi:hypothetical protein D3C73_987440 [compost metagenome]
MIFSFIQFVILRLFRRCYCIPFQSCLPHQPGYLSRCAESPQYSQEILRFPDDMRDDDSGQRQYTHGRAGFPQRVQLMDKFAGLAAGRLHQPLRFHLKALVSGCGRSECDFEQPPCCLLGGGEDNGPLIQQVDVRFLKIRDNPFNNFGMFLLLCLPEDDLFENAHRQQ